jgi:mono/diheme cytochrome c family protein
VPQEAQLLKNPITKSVEMTIEGRDIFLGAGNCYVCHGNEGKGDGEAGALLNPKPSNLADPTFQRVRKDGEIFWAIKHGVPSRGMFSYVPRMITEEQAWKVVVYIRSLG